MRPSQYLYDYQTEPSKKYCLAFNNGSCNWQRGKMIGGSGGVNAMIYIRGNQGDFDKWKQDGNEGWGWNDVLPYFDKTINFGDGLGLNINHFSSIPPLSKLILKSAQESGQPFLENYLETNVSAYSYIWANQDNGRRESTGKAYVASVKDRANLNVFKNSVVKKINFVNNVAKSVDFIYKDQQAITVHAKKEIILSAGAIDSSKLLMLSGIGPKPHLQKMKIPVITDLPVGYNLQDHFSVLMFFKLNRTTFEVQNAMNLDYFYQYLRNGTGPLSGISTLSLVGMVNTEPDETDKYPNVGLYHVPHENIEKSLKDYGLDRNIAQPLLNLEKDFVVLEILVCVMRARSKGKVLLKSKNYKDNPVINANYLSDKYDLDTAIKGLKYQISFENSATFKSINGEFVKLNLKECDKYPFKSDSYLKCYVKYMGTTIYHPIGSNKMGNISDTTAVVDTSLKVKGTEGLRVIDASIMPTMVTANVNAATIMVGEKGSDIIMKHWQGK